MGARTRSGPWVGLQDIEWSNPGAVSDEHFVVVLGNRPESKPQAFKVGATGALVGVDSVPFDSVVIRRFKQAQTEGLRRALRAVTRVFSGVLVASIAIVLLTGLVQLRLVASESMSGTFEKDDMVIVVSPQVAEVAMGSIIVFHYYNLDRTEMIGDFSHRIIGGTAVEGWVTQGDANPDPDLSPVLSQDIIGVVVGWIPGIGMVLRPQIVLGVMVLLFIAVILGPEIKDALKGRRR